MFPALSFHFGLSPSEMCDMPLRVLNRYIEFLNALGGDDDG